MSLSREEAGLLRKRVLEFLAEAEHAASSGRYDVACFLAEQTLQLYLKIRAPPSRQLSQDS